MRFGKLGAMLILVEMIAGCGGGSTSIVVSVTPVSATVVLTGTQQFGASVRGASNTNVTWQVCNPAPASDATGTSGSTITLPTGCVTSSSKLGTISTTGLYTAPATLPNPPTVSLAVTSQADTTVFAVVNITLDSGIRVSVSPTNATVGTGEQFQFTATVTGSANGAVDWSVNQIANGDSTVGMITPTACMAPQPLPPPNPNNPPNGPGVSVACYTAPVSSQSAGVSVEATSAVDNRESGTAAVSVPTAVDPTLSTLEPMTATEGSIQQDLYITGRDFFSTDLVFVNGTQVPSYFVGTSSIHAYLPSDLMQGPVPSTLSVTLQRQNGGFSQPLTLPLQPARPAIVSSAPDSLLVGSSSGSVNLNGGYFSPSTQATWQGQPRPITLTNSRQLTVSLSGSDLSMPGLFPVLIQNNDVPSGSPSVSSFNIAVAPSPSSIAPAPNPPITVGIAPVAIGVDSGLGTAVIVDQGTGGNPGSVTLLDLNTSPPTVSATLTVGVMPTSVSVDDILHVAAVVNSADNTISIVDLQAQAVLTTYDLPANPTGANPPPSNPSPLPYSIGVNPLTHRAIVAYSSTNIGTILDLSTNPPTLVCIMGGSNPNMPNNCATIPNTNTSPVSTGPTPSVAVEPQLNLAVVTPGGSGTTTLVDLGTPATASQVARVPNVDATIALSTSQQGAAMDTESGLALLTDPNQATLTLFSVLDQTTSLLQLDKGEVAAAINPLTDIGVTVNAVAGTATALNLETLQKITTVTVGTLPEAVAIDPGSNAALVVNQGSGGGNGSVSVWPLGPIWSPEITEVSPPSSFTTSQSGSLAVTVNGFGFQSDSTVRLDGTAVPTVVNSSGRQAVATIPGSMLGSARRYSLDVMNAGGATSNEESLAIIAAVPIGLNPVGVAVDEYLNEALVTSQGPVDPSTGVCSGPGTASVVDLAAATVIQTFAVGTCPEGIATLPRQGRAVIANNGSNNATVLDYVNGVTINTVSTGLQPMGVSVDPDTATAVIANFGSNTASLLSFGTGAVPSVTSSVPVDQGPVATSVDPIDNLAAVAANTQNTLDIIDLSSHFIIGRISNSIGPSDMSYDPITDTFLVANSLQNELYSIDPLTFVPTAFRVGINPTALAYNMQTSTAVTINRSSNTMSIVDFTNQKTKIVLPISGSPEFSVAINPITNIAAVVDQANGRLLLVPLPR